MAVLGGAGGGVGRGALREGEQGAEPCPTGGTDCGQRRGVGRVLTGQGGDVALVAGI